jgi:mannose/fructose/N-acetylgalactosamine-specific phosphotransferase system component IIC
VHLQHNFCIGFFSCGYLNGPLCLYSIFGAFVASTQFSLACSGENHFEAPKSDMGTTGCGKNKVAFTLEEKKAIVLRA